SPMTKTGVHRGGPPGRHQPLCQRPAVGRAGEGVAAGGRQVTDLLATPTANGGEDGRGIPDAAATIEPQGLYFCDEGRRVLHDLSRYRVVNGTASAPARTTAPAKPRKL